MQPEGSLSHRSAAALWELLPYPATAPVWVTVAPERGATRPRIKVCRTRSPAERALLRLLRESGIEGYETNAKVGGYELDFIWDELSFAVEVDGYDAHSGRVAFERDRLKIATLEALGLTVMPVTGRQIRNDEDGVLERLLRALELAGYRA